MLAGFIIGLITGIILVSLLNIVLQEDLSRVERDRDYYKSKAKNYLEMLNARKDTYEKVECPWESKDNCRVCKGDKAGKERERMSALWELYEKERSKLSSLPNVDDDFVALGKVYDIVAKSNDDGLKKSWIEDIYGINAGKECKE